MKNKRGQVTIFIIIAIVIVVAIAIVIFIQQTQQGSSGGIQVIKSYLDSCFEERANQVVSETAKQGFYYDLPTASIIFLGEKTAYYLKDEQDLVPTTTTIEQELNKAMDKNMLPCLSLSQFREEYDITWSDCFSSSSLKDEGIEFSINCDITITKGITTSRLEEFKTSIACNAKKLINASNFIIDEYEKKPGYICLECFDNIAKANGITIEIIPITAEVFEPEHVWFIIEDKDTEKQINNKNLTLRFVADLE